jgi:hypothetical protein
MPTQPAGWYNDPYGRFQQRHWDGEQWTERVSTNGIAQVDPLGTSTVIPIAIPRTAYETPGGSSTQAFAAAADPNDPNAEAAEPEPAAAPNAVTMFLDGLGPDAKLRPHPGLRAAVAGLGGVVLAIGVLVAATGNDPSRGRSIGVSLALIAGAWGLRTFVKVAEVGAAAVGIVVVGIPAFAIASTVSDGRGGFPTGLLLAAVFIAAWALPGFRSRNLLLGLGALALVGAFGALSATDRADTDKCDQYTSDGDYARFDAECGSIYQPVGIGLLPIGITDNLGTQGAIYLAGAAMFLGLTWWLDRRGYRGTGTGLCAAGLFAAVVGTVLLANKFGGLPGPILVLVVGLLICVVGAHGSRRATTWWGAALATIGMVAIVEVQWKPDSTGAIGGVAIVSGLLLLGIALLVGAISASNATTAAGPPASVPAGVAAHEALSDGSGARS